MHCKVKENSISSSLKESLFRYAHLPHPTMGWGAGKLSYPHIQGHEMWPSLLSAPTPSARPVPQWKAELPGLSWRPWVPAWVTPMVLQPLSRPAPICLSSPHIHPSSKPAKGSPSPQYTPPAPSPQSGALGHRLSVPPSPSSLAFCLPPGTRSVLLYVFLCGPWSLVR